MTVFAFATFPLTVTVNFAELWPLRTTTLAGTGTVARSVLDRDTVIAAGAGRVRLTVPVTVSPTLALPGLSDSEASAGGMALAVKLMLPQVTGGCASVGAFSTSRNGSGI